MAEDDDIIQPEDEASEGKKKKPKRKFDLGSILVTLAVFGFIAENVALMAVYKPWSNGMPSPEGVAMAASGPTAAVATPTPVFGPRSVLELENFVVNLADKDEHRYAKARLQLGFDSADAVTVIGTNPILLAPARQRVIEIMAACTAEQVTNPAGKEKLRNDIKEALSTVGWPARLTDVFITEFLVQF